MPWASGSGGCPSNGGAIWSTPRDRYWRPPDGSHGSSPRSPPSGAARHGPGGHRVARPSSTPIPATVFPRSQEHPSNRAAKRRRGADSVRSRERVDEYDQKRDVPAVDGTSQLSADLRFGVLAPGCRGRSDRDVDQREGCLRPPAGLAGLVRPSPVGVAVAGRRRLTPRVRQRRMGERPGRHHGLARRAHRLSPR